MGKDNEKNSSQLRKEEQEWIGMVAGNAQLEEQREETAYRMGKNLCQVSIWKETKI